MDCGPLAASWHGGSQGRRQQVLEGGEGPAGALVPEPGSCPSEACLAGPQPLLDTHLSQVPCCAHRPKVEKPVRHGVAPWRPHTNVEG